MDTTIEIPGYRIQSELGKGAMATVFLAIQESLERRVALKVMASSLSADSSFCRRFLKEGRIVGQLIHPNIVTVYDIGEYQNHYYMAMEYIGGGTLKALIAEGLRPERAVEIFCQLASALGYAHRLGFIHRDIKPANVLFRSDGTAILSDFGIAKALGGESTQLTAVGMTVGTPSYMSPEQALGRDLDGRSDLYSLGVVLYEMLTGIKPYQSEDSFTIALMHINNPPPHLPDELSAYQEICDRLLAKDPNDRFAKAEDAIEAIRKVRRSSPSFAAMTDDALATATGQAVPAPRSKRLFWLLGLGLLIPVAGALTYVLLQEPVISRITPPSDDTEITDVSTTPPSRTDETKTDEIAKIDEAPPEEVQVLDERTKEQINILLQVAAAHQSVGRLASPPGSNAVESYQRILEINPSNTQAKTGLKAIADEYASRAKQSLKNGDPPSTTLDLVEAGLSAQPNHPELRRMRQQLKQQMQ